jgi:hypothetical protein
VSTLPDVTVLPFLQTLPSSADNGKARFPAGSKASAFLIPYRSHFDADEVWTPDELEEVRRRTSAYNEVITGIARHHGYTVVDIAEVSRRMAADSTFSSASSPYFSPDLHHPSFRAHRAIADRVIETMAAIANAAAPDTLAHPDPPLPSAADMASRQRRVNALMHLAIQGLQIGPLPGKVSWRISLEGGGQFGDERVGDAVLVALGGIEGLPVPVSTRDVLRLCAHVRVIPVAIDTRSQEVSIFPSRGLEGRLGLAFERIGAWSWQRVELGGLVTPDDSVDFGVYAREEWRALYVEAASRGWLFDRLEIGLRFGHLWGRPGRNGN